MEAVGVDTETEKVLGAVAKKFFDKFIQISKEFGCIAKVAHGLSSEVDPRNVDRDTRELLIQQDQELDPTITATNLYSFTKLSRAQRRIAQGKRN